MMKSNPMKLGALLSATLVIALAACGGTPNPGGGGSSSVAGLLIFPGRIDNPPAPPPPAPPPPAGNAFAGTLTAPSGGSVQNTLIAACVVTSATSFNCSDPNSKGGKVDATGSSANFSLSGLAATKYVVYAWKDVDGSGGGKPNAGDLFTFFGDDGTGKASIVQPPKSGVNLPMYAVTGTNRLGSSSMTNSSSLTATTTSLETQVSVAQANDLPIDPARRNKLHRVEGTAFVPGEVIVKFRAGLRTQGLSTLQARVGAQDIGVTAVRALGVLLPATSLYRANTDAAGTLELARSLSTRGDVEYAEPNYISYALKSPNDSSYNLQWHYKAINLEAAWDVTDGTAGTAVTVAVVDTGSSNHPDLQNTFVGGYDFVSDAGTSGDGDGRDANPSDEGGDSGYHGSHVAGTIAAQTNNARGGAGVSWGAKVVPVRVLDTRGSGTGTDIVAGIQWAAGISVTGVPDNPNPAKVINLSLGGKRGCSQTEQQLYTGLKARGVVVVVAAGNEDDDTNSYAPSSCRDVIVVGATGPQGARAPYSNYGSRIDVMAPGGDSTQSITVGGKTYPAGVLSTVLNANGDPVYAFYDGTSMATPHVAGLAALMLSKDPTLSPDAVLARLRSASTALSPTACVRPSGGDCGAGLVDALRALNATGNPNPGPTPPAPPAPPPPPTAALETYVAALRCAQANNCTLFDSDGSVLVTVKAAKSQVSFQLGGLKAGTYAAAAWQDLNKNRTVDAGEPFGIFPSPVVIGENQNLSGLVIRLQPYTESATNSLNTTRSRLEDALGALARR